MSLIRTCDVEGCDNVAVVGVLEAHECPRDWIKIERVVTLRRPPPEAPAVTLSEMQGPGGQTVTIKSLTTPALYVEPQTYEQLHVAYICPRHPLPFKVREG